MTPRGAARQASECVAPPIEPVLALLAESLAESGDFLFEGKWDGFRGIVFRGGGSDLYFPELRSG